MRKPLRTVPARKEAMTAEKWRIALPSSEAREAASMEVVPVRCVIA